jgi:hypothetical protein
VSIPTTRTINDIKNLLLRPATTSHFDCFFNPPPTVADFMKNRANAGAGVDVRNFRTMDRINISCCDATLPGSSLQTAQLTDSYPGVTETYAYRRAYDNRSDFTFYVDYLENGALQSAQAYSVILFFENWISYAAGEKYSAPKPTDKGDDFRPAFIDSNYFNRVNFPKDYIAQKIRIRKFEKEASGKTLVYDFVNAFPITMASMPVSYEGTDVLKTTVSFSYQRYSVTTAVYTGGNSSVVSDNRPNRGIFDIPELAPSPTASVNQPGPIPLQTVPFLNN